jgi:hypothetical protein
MSILLGHGFTGNGPFGSAWIERWLARLRAASIDVHSIQLGLDVPGRRLPWPELDRRWKRGDHTLMRFYERVADAAASADVLVNYGGVNLHPAFLDQLSTVTVLGFFDDPEASESFSRPVAATHDICMVGNIAALDDYARWGARRVRWWPNGFRAEDFDPTLTRERILEGARDVDVALLCERLTHYRRARVDRFALAFPTGVYRGPGWPAGFLPESERIALLQRTKVGINIHNTTGPINFRTFYLPANGVLQICDNRSHLGKVFALEKEVVGFDTIDEAIDLCRYYLGHDRERREVAAAGWVRSVRDYNEIACFDRLTTAVREYLAADRRDVSSVRPPITVLREHAALTRPRRLRHLALLPLVWPLHAGRRYGVGATRRLARYRDTMRLRFAAWWQRRRAGSAAG